MPSSPGPYRRRGRLRRKGGQIDTRRLRRRPERRYRRRMDLSDKQLESLEAEKRAKLQRYARRIVDFVEDLGEPDEQDRGNALALALVEFMRETHGETFLGQNVMGAAAAMCPHAAVAGMTIQVSEGRRRRETLIDCDA